MLNLNDVSNGLDPFDYRGLLSLLIKVVLVLIVLNCLLGCTSTTVEDSSSQLQATSIKAVLTQCINAPVGEVGDTNLSLAKGYVRSTQSLLICQEVSLSVAEGLDSIYLNKGD